MTPKAGKVRHLDTGCLTKDHMIVWNPKGIPTRSMENGIVHHKSWPQNMYHTHNWPQQNLFISFHVHFIVLPWTHADRNARWLTIYNINRSCWQLCTRMPITHTQIHNRVHLIPRKWHAEILEDLLSFHVVFKYWKLDHHHYWGNQAPNLCQLIWEIGILGYAANNAYTDFKWLFLYVNHIDMYDLY